jgi:hypothetical protein
MCNIPWEALILYPIVKEQVGHYTSSDIFSTRHNGCPPTQVTNYDYDCVELSYSKISYKKIHKYRLEDPWTIEEHQGELSAQQVVAFSQTQMTKSCWQFSKFLKKPIK